MNKTQVGEVVEVYLDHLKMESGKIVESGENSTITVRVPATFAALCGRKKVLITIEEPSRE